MSSTPMSPASPTPAGPPAAPGLAALAAGLADPARPSARSGTSRPGLEQRVPDLRPAVVRRPADHPDVDRVPPRGQAAVPVQAGVGTEQGVAAGLIAQHLEERVGRGGVE